MSLSIHQRRGIQMSQGATAAGGRIWYEERLREFDSALCEAVAVSQATAGRMPELNVSYATYVFTQMCGAGVSMVRAAPLSRWIRADSDDWRFGAVAGHARSLVDGFLLFHYLIEPSQSEAELNARINVMHLNDCTRRLNMFASLGAASEVEGFEKQREELRQRLTSNAYFNTLTPPVQKNCLSGKFLMIDNRDAMLSKVGFEKGQFDALYDLWSQHVHILPVSFYRIEANGRGTGLENDTDRTYIGQALEVGAAVLTESTDLMVEQFPDVAQVRQETRSTFSPGPKENAPRWTFHEAPAKSPDCTHSPVATAVKSAFGLGCAQQVGPLR